MTSPRFRSLGEGALVGGAFAALVAVVAVWLALDQRPPEWDHANHLERVVACAKDIGRGDVRAILERSAFYPPLVSCTAALVYRLWPSDVAAAQAVVLAFLGLGMLTKPPFAVYVLPALVFVAARIRARRGVVNAGLAALIAGALALPWYGPRLFGIAPDIAARSFRQAAESGHPDPLTAAALALYPTWFLPQFGFVAVLLFAIGLVVGARRRQWLLLASGLAPFALF